MEVKINREIREYTESMFFGLSLRQFIFSVLACIVAVCAYFLLRPHLGTETVSWVCILVAVPFAVVGCIFVMEKQEMNIKSEILIPKRLVFRNTNLYWQMIEQGKKDKGKKKKGRFKNDKNTEKDI